MNGWLIRRRRTNQPPVNLVANPSVELGDVDPTSWFHSDHTEWVTGNAYDGDKALRINVANGTADWRSAVFPVVGGKTYRVGVWVKGAADIVTVLPCRWWSDEAGTSYITENWLVLEGANPVWTKYQHDLVAPANAVSADLMFRAAFDTTVDVFGDMFFVYPLD